MYSAMLQFIYEEYLYTYPPLSVAIYPFTQLSELDRRGMKELVQVCHESI